ncbi:MAG: hypothetical protein JWO38_6060 [Gemmataceae bacterium]|nr:hypothetical protein [Gemmataceae bacterium]
MSILSRKAVRTWLAVAAGGAAIGVAVAQPPATSPAPGKAPTSTVSPESTTPVDPARTADPLGSMLTDAKAAYARVRDYVCVFTRQERVNGVLGAEQVAELKVRTKPFSMAIRFARPDAVAGLEAKFTSTTLSGKMKYRPAGAKGLNGTQMLSPDDPKVMAETRHPLTELGVGPVIDRLATIASREKTLGNPVEVYASDFQFAGRNVARYEMFTRRSHVYRYAYRCLVYVDKETKLPVRFEAYDEAKPGTTVGDLLEAYSYTDIKVNVGLGDSAFE